MLLLELFFSFGIPEKVVRSMLTGFLRHISYQSNFPCWQNIHVIAFPTVSYFNLCVKSIKTGADRFLYHVLFTRKFSGNRFPLFCDLSALHRNIRKYWTGGAAKITIQLFLSAERMEIAERKIQQREPLLALTTLLT